MKESNVVLGWIFVLFDIFLLGCGLYAVKKKLKNKENTMDFNDNKHSRRQNEPGTK